MSDGFQVSTPLRMIIGGLLVVCSLTAILVGVRLDWGLAAMVVVPALLLLVPGLALSERRELQLHDGRLLIVCGLLRRRRIELPLHDCALESVPTAGLRTVLLHMGGSEYAIAAWLRHARAEALCAWLDRAAPQGAWPRRSRAAAEWDR